MIDFIEKLEEAKGSNLVFLLQNKEDLSLLSGLDLDEKIIEKLQQITSKKENKNISFFL
jgi:hypothetical protein